MESPSAPASQPKTSAQAIWSLVLGILSMGCLWLLGSVPAIILGILGIRNIDRNPDKLRGKGLAIAGIITGAIGVLSGALTAGILFSARTQMNDAIEEAEHTINARQIVMACILYAEDNGNNLPSDLGELVTKGYLDDAEILNFASSEAGEMDTFRIVSGSSSFVSDPLKPLIYSPLIDGQDRIVGFFDGSVRRIPETEFQELISRGSSGPR